MDFLKITEYLGNLEEFIKKNQNFSADELIELVKNAKYAVSNNSLPFASINAGYKNTEIDPLKVEDYPVLKHKIEEMKESDKGLDCILIASKFSKIESTDLTFSEYDKDNVLVELKESKCFCVVADYEKNNPIRSGYSTIYTTEQVPELSYKLVPIEDLEKVLSKYETKEIEKSEKSDIER